VAATAPTTCHVLVIDDEVPLRRPDLPVMVISGFTSTIHSIIRQGSRFRIMQKPFTRSELQATVGALVQRALDMPSAASGSIHCSLPATPK
jgi:hypothetical protein